MILFSWLNNKKYDISILTLWSIFISYLIKTFYSLIHSVILSQTDINDFLKVFIYVITGVILPFVVHKIIRSSFIQKILYKTNNKSVNEDIFNDIIDYDLPTMMQVYIKNSDVYYIGKFSFREEKGLDSWIVLINYGAIKKNKNKLIYDPENFNLKSSVAINLRDVERIELIYEKDSEVWKRLSGEENTSSKNENKE